VYVHDITGFGQSDGQWSTTVVQLSTVRYGEFPLGGLVYGPGGDEFTDFLRLGAPLRIILMVATTLAIVAIRRPPARF